MKWAIMYIKIIPPSITLILDISRHNQNYYLPELSSQSLGKSRCRRSRIRWPFHYYSKMVHQWQEYLHHLLQRTRNDPVEHLPLHEKFWFLSTLERHYCRGDLFMSKKRHNNSIFKKNYSPKYIYVIANYFNHLYVTMKLKISREWSRDVIKWHTCVSPKKNVYPQRQKSTQGKYFYQIMIVFFWATHF